MTEFPGTLRTWRKARRLSQLDLALEADVSSRHISFLESGRARPSREMIGRLCDAMGLPLDARNQMLTHAGFAARYPKRRWDDEEMRPIVSAMDHMLDSHDPYPGFALDREWNVVRMNKGATALFAPLGVSPGGSMLELVMSETLPGIVSNWPDVAYHTCQRLRTESAAHGGLPLLDRAADHLGQVSRGDAPVRSPVVSIELALGDKRLALFSTLGQFGTPEDVLIDALRIELFFPADTETEAILTALHAGEPIT